VTLLPLRRRGQALAGATSVCVATSRPVHRVRPRARWCRKKAVARTAFRHQDEQFLAPDGHPRAARDDDVSRPRKDVTSSA